MPVHVKMYTSIHTMEMWITWITSDDAHPQVFL